MTNGGRHTALRTRMATSNPSVAQCESEVRGGGASIGKVKSPTGRSARYTPSKNAGRSVGRKCPTAPKVTARSKSSAKARARASARTPPGVRVCAARLREHAGAEVDARDPSLAQGPENLHARAGTAAHVQSLAERPEVGQRVGGGAENALRGTKRRVVELRS